MDHNAKNVPKASVRESVWQRVKNVLLEDTQTSKDWPRRVKNVLATIVLFRVLYVRPANIK